MFHGVSPFRNTMICRHFMTVTACGLQSQQVGQRMMAASCGVGL
jgi:hypothetical protein